MALQLQRRGTVFLNVPFDSKYEPLFVALIASLVALKRQPTCVLDVPGDGAVRRDRLIEHIADCELSIHDLSRVQSGRVNNSLVPRFNMPFELGLAMAIARFDRQRPKHGLFVLEEKRHRLRWTLSDVNGIDPQIHGGTQRGVIRCMLNLLAGGAVGQIQRIELIAKDLLRFVRATCRESDAEDMFEPYVFRQTLAAAAVIVEAHPEA